MGDNEIGATDACGEQPMEQTPGQRIAATHAYGALVRTQARLAAAIDEAIREAREEAALEMEAELDAQCSRAHVAEQQLAAKEADCAAMRRYCVHIGDCPARRLEVDDRRCTCGLMAALASNAGADLLARLRAAEERVEEYKQAIWKKNEQLAETGTEAVLLRQELRAAEERWRKVKEWARGFDPLTKHANLACAVAARLAEEGYGREKARAEAAEEKAAAQAALDQVKAALGDRLLARGPLSKPYAHAVMSQIDDALHGGMAALAAHDQKNVEFWISNLVDGLANGVTAWTPEVKTALDAHDERVRRETLEAAADDAEGESYKDARMEWAKWLRERAKGDSNG